MFDALTRDLLQQFATSPPKDETIWLLPWKSILSDLFPRSQRYFVASLLPRDKADDKNRTPYLKAAVYKASDFPVQLRTVLIVAIMHSPEDSEEWRGSLLESEINRLTDDALSSTASEMGAVSEVYWIGVNGPRWLYGVKEDNGRKLEPLIDWHDTTNDQASYNDFQTLAKLVAKM